MSKTVKIGPIIYNIIETPTLQDGGEPLDGQFVHSQSAILIESTLGGPAKRATIWHEILHALLVHAGYAEHDECRIAALSYGVMQVLQDNPWLAEQPEQAGDSDSADCALGALKEKLGAY